MPLAGSAFLALYNDFDPARDDEYNRWHSREHVPQRLTVPGMLRARRCVNRADPRYPYFTLYELASAQVLASPAYRLLLDHPSPWSARIRPSFREFLRVPCRTLASHGDSLGGALAVLRVEAAALPDAARVAAACAGAAALDGMAAAHAGLQDATLQGPAVAAARPLPVGAACVFVFEAQEARLLARHRAAIEAAVHEALRGTQPQAFDWREYALMELVLQGRPAAAPAPA